MRLLTRYQVRLHLAQLVVSLAGLTLVLLAAVTLMAAPLLAALDPAHLILVATTAAARCALASLPAAVLLAVVGAGVGLRRRNELVALEACGHGRADRRRVALGLGVAAALLGAVASRALVPALRRAEHEARAAALLTDPDAALRWLSDEGGAGVALGADEAVAGELREVFVWSRRGAQPLVVRAATGRLLPADDGALTASLGQVQVLGADAQGPVPVEVLSLDRLDVTLRLPASSAHLRRSEASVDELWEARRTGRLQSRERLDLELGERAAEALLCVVFAWLGFVIAERAPRRRDVAPYALALIALGAHLLVRSQGRRLASGPLPTWLAPSLGPAALALGGLVLDRLAARWRP